MNKKPDLREVIVAGDAVAFGPSSDHGAVLRGQVVTSAASDEFPHQRTLAELAGTPATGRLAAAVCILFAPRLSRS